MPRTHCNNMHPVSIYCAVVVSLCQAVRCSVCIEAQLTEKYCQSDLAKQASLQQHRARRLDAPSALVKNCFRLNHYACSTRIVFETSARLYSTKLKRTVSPCYLRDRFRLLQERLYHACMRSIPRGSAHAVLGSRTGSNSSGHTQMEPQSKAAQIVRSDELENGAPHDGQQHAA